MTKNEYLIELATRLQALTVNKNELYPEVWRLVSFYQEMIEDRIEDGLSEEDAVAGMEPISDIVERVRHEIPIVEVVVNKDADKAADEDDEDDEDDNDDDEDGLADEKAFAPKSTGRANGKYTHMTKTFEGAAVKRITVADQNRAVRVQAGDAVKIEYVDGPDGHYDVSFEGGELRVRFIPENWGLRMLFGARVGLDTTFVLTLPKVFDGDLDVRTSNGSVSAAHVGVSKTMLLRTSNGRLTVEHVSAEHAKFVTSNGGIRLEHVSAMTVAAQSSNARIESEHVAANEVTITTSNGANEARSIAGSVVRIETCNGHLSVDRVAGDDITLTSSNGGITGTIRGRMEDYAITSRTSNGKNNLPAASAGPKKLNVRTSNSRIDIIFEN